MSTEIVDRGTSLKTIVRGRLLHSAVQTVAHAVTQRTPLPILNHILIQSEGEGLRLSATDLEVAISLTIPAVIQEAGALTAPARLLTDVLSALPDGDLSIQVDRSSSVQIQCARSLYKLNGMPAEEYPRLPEVQDDVSFTIGQAILRQMIRQTIFAASSDLTRVILTGVLFAFEDSTLKMVATDTHRLALRAMPVVEGKGSQSAIVSARGLKEVLRVLEAGDGNVRVNISKSQISFETPAGPMVISRLIEGQFPNYERVTRIEPTREVAVHTGMLLRAAQGVAIIARTPDAIGRVMINTAGDRLKLSAVSPSLGTASEEVEAARKGADFSMPFNVNYLIDALQVIDTEGCDIKVAEEKRPVLVEPVIEKPQPGEQFLTVLMPMQEL